MKENSRNDNKVTSIMREFAKEVLGFGASFLLFLLLLLLYFVPGVITRKEGKETLIFLIVGYGVIIVSGALIGVWRRHRH